MTCHECELMLALDQRSPEAEAHVAECAECRSLAQEMAANADALREMSGEPMPQVRSAVLAEIRAQESRRRVMRWGWALAAAAAAVLAIGVAKKDRAVTPVLVSKGESPVAHPVQAQEVARLAITRPMHHRRLESRRQPERLTPLRVKMLTSDPNVVIYWLVEAKEGSE